MNHFTSEIVAAALSLGLEQKHLRTLCSEYAVSIYIYYAVLSVDNVLIMATFTMGV